MNHNIENDFDIQFDNEITQQTRIMEDLNRPKFVCNEDLKKISINDTSRIRTKHNKTKFRIVRSKVHDIVLNRTKKFQKLRPIYKSTALPRSKSVIQYKKARQVNDQTPTKYENFHEYVKSLLTQSNSASKF